MRARLSVIFFVLIVTSCMQDEAQFSCDPVINAYVAAHQDELSIISVSELASSDIIFQQAVFRSFGAAKKREVWLQKIQILIDSKYYSGAECLHLIKLREHISADYFTAENIESLKAERQAFSTEWILFAKQNLFWTDTDISFIVYTLFITKAQFESELEFINSVQAKSPNITGDPVTCNCNLDSSFCVHNCTSSSCIITTGCGWFWTGSCNGICS